MAKQLRNHELVDQLQTLDKDMLVRVEGCDCQGQCIGAVVEDDYILIIRNGGEGDGRFYESEDPDGN